MALLVEEAKWEEGIYQLETYDLVEGGPEGIDNIQARALANRTLFLKGKVNIATDLSPGITRSNNEPGNVSVNETGVMTANGLPEMIIEMDLLKAKLEYIKNGFFSDVTKNPFFVTFGNSNGWELVSGVWNRPYGRVEC